jgi:hypothetical protein
VKLWIDADAAPQVVKEICFRTSDRLKLDTVLVANQRVMIPPENQLHAAVCGASRYLRGEVTRGWMTAMRKSGRCGMWGTPDEAARVPLRTRG